MPRRRSAAGSAARRCSPALGTPETTRARVVIVDKPGAPQTQLRVATIGAARSSPDFRPLQVMNTALGGLFSSRINMNLREKNGYTYGAYSHFAFRRSQGRSRWRAASAPMPRRRPSPRFSTKSAASRRSRLGADELQKAKDSLANSLPGAFETSANAVNSFSNVFTYDLGLDYYTRYAQQVNAVTTEQALNVALRYLQPDRLVVVAVGDRKVIEPELAKLNLGSIEIRDAEGRVTK